MANHIITTSTTAGVTMADGDYTYVAQNVDVTNSNGYGISGSGDGAVEVDGSVLGSDGVHMTGDTGAETEVSVGTTGVVSAYGIGSAVYCYQGDLEVNNSGQINIAAGSPVKVAYAIYAQTQGSATVINSATGTIRATGIASDAIEALGVLNVINYGLIEGSAVAISCGNYAGFQMTNYGTILGVIDGHAGIDTINNFGTIDGNVDPGVASITSPTHIYNKGIINGTFDDPGRASWDDLTNTGTINGNIHDQGGCFIDSSTGIVNGTIYVESNSSEGDTIVAGLDGGSVVGDVGNDNLQANRSATAAGNHVHFTLDGAGGVNALYGGGAFTTFDLGDAAGGHNQIHGGLSQMTDVAGYANNTLDFSKTPSTRSAYVDLLNGHNAYLYANANHTGTLTFEDSIQNVPNVIGSAGGDVIRADNGTDVIQGGGGGDILYAGTGFDTFVYTGYADSNTSTGYDTIAGFVTGKDKLDLSALNSDGSHLVFSNGSNATTLYLEATPGKFTASTDLAISFTGAHAIVASDVIL